MATRISDTRAITLLIVVALHLAGTSVCAGDEVLERFVGHWDVRLKTTYPTGVEVTYRETYEWVLNHQFVRGETEPLPDGAKSIFYGTYDRNFDSYPFWWFMSSGIYSVALAGKWDVPSRTLTWKSPPVSDSSFQMQMTFTDERTRRWTYIVKNLYGTVLRQEGVAIRRDVGDALAEASPPVLIAPTPETGDIVPARRSGIAELTPQLLSILFLLVIIVAPVLTLILSSLLLWRYRRSVMRQMETHGGVAESSADDASSARERDDDALIGEALGRALYRHAMRGPWKVALRYTAAGLALACVFAVAARFVYPFRLDLFGFLIGVMIYGWPIVPSLILVFPTTWHWRWVFVGAYFAAFLLLLLWAGGSADLRAAQFGGVELTHHSPASPAGVLWLWLVVNGMPTLAVLLCFNKWARPVASLVVGFVTTAVSGVLVTYLGLFSQFGFEAAIALAVSLHLHPGWLVAVTILVSLAVFGIIGWTLARWISRKYRQGEVSDQSLMLDALWLLFASYYALWLIFDGLKWTVTAPVAFAVYKLVLMIARTTTARPPKITRDLTFLRVFSLGRRSERLLDSVARYWRHIGNVQMITGPDVARSTVHPHQFLDFLSGRLATHFVRDDASLDRSVAQGKRAAGWDGRFAISNFFCYADSWQRLLTELLQQDDVVLMDLRSFSAENAGCIHELRYLVNTVPIERCLLVVDNKTDMGFLEQILAAAWQSLSPDSPNANRSLGEIPLYLYDGKNGAGRRLMWQLCKAAAVTSTV